MTSLELQKLKMDIETMENQLKLHPPTSGMHKFMVKDLAKMKKQLQKVEVES